MQPHRYSEIFPLMSTEEFRALVTDIVNHGLQEPVTVFEGKVLDGRNRDRACREVGVKLRTVEFTGDQESALRWVTARNLHRRNLSSQQKAACALQALKHYEDIAKEKQREGQRKGGGDNISQEAVSKKQITEKIQQTALANGHPDPKPVRQPTATEQAAGDFGTNMKYIHEMKKIHEADPELVEKVKNNELKLPEAKKLASAKARNGKPSSRKSKPKAAPASRFDPEKRWRKTTYPMLARDLEKWPKSFHTVLISYLREWAVTLENSL